MTSPTSSEEQEDHEHDEHEGELERERDVVHRRLDRRRSTYKVDT
jgi:hypothetical protein